jgi:hypothetical protein
MIWYASFRSIPSSAELEFTRVPLLARVAPA